MGRTPAGTGSGQSGPTDSQLVARARRGDHAAFHELVDRHGPALYGVAASLVGNATDAEDIVQETFSGAFRGLKGFQGRSSVKTWLMRILFRQGAAQLRRRGRSAEVAMGVAERVAEGGGSATAASDARMDVAAAMSALSPDHREVLVLREMEGLSYEQIAEVLSVPRGTVESRLFRARKAMQEMLKGYLG